jgi:peptidoglycan/xylan/chitin deacetylase (PgdA/CDA1 family)
MTKRYIPPIYHLFSCKSGKLNKKPALVFTFDDGSLTDYTLAFPFMRNLGVKGTSYINTATINDSNKLTWEQIFEMKNSGLWDVQCHTHNHANLSELTDLQIRQEMEFVNSAFITAGLQPPRHHALPFGAGDADARAIVAEYRDTIRLIGSIDIGTHINTYETLDLHRLRGVSIDTQSMERVDEIKNYISAAYHNSRVVFLYTHKIITEPQEYQYQILLSCFEEIVNHINNIGIETLTVSEFYERQIS